MKSIIKFLNISLSAALLALCAGCEENAYNDVPAEEEQLSAVIFGSADDAVSGEILIKFRPEVSGVLDKAPQTRSGSSNVLQTTGIENVDELLDYLGGCTLERVFPIDSRKETETRSEGLHLWYTVRFDENADVKEVAHRLAHLGELSKVQYNVQLQRNDKAAPVSLRVSDYAPAAASGPFNDPSFGLQWALKNTGSFADGEQMANMVEGCDIGVEEAWKLCTGDESIIVAVLDEGVMFDHPDLKDNMWVNEGETYGSGVDADGNGYAGDVYGYDFVNNSGIIYYNSTSDTGHATHCAGVIAARNNNGEGVCGIAGGDAAAGQPGVKIMSLIMYQGTTAATMLNECKAIKYAADNGAVVLQCSWGYNSALSDAVIETPVDIRSDEDFENYAPLEKEALDYFLHHAGSPDGVIEGGVAVFASGNNYAPMASFPGGYSPVVCVSAICADYTPSTFTNYGYGVDIAAPGGDTDYHSSERGGILSTLPPFASDGIGYGYMDGTSMACPQVSGVVALGLSYAAKLHKHFTGEQFAELVTTAVRPIDEYLTGEKKYNYLWETLGDTHPTIVDLGTTYRGQMGSGVVRADLLLQAVADEANGTAMKLSNLYVPVGGSRSTDVRFCFEGGESASFTASASDSSIAEVTVNGSIVTVIGKAAGITSLTVTASTGESQTSSITVRETAGDNGWL